MPNRSREIDEPLDEIEAIEIGWRVRIPTMPATHSDLIPATISF